MLDHGGAPANTDQDYNGARLKNSKDKLLPDQDDDDAHDEEDYDNKDKDGNGGPQHSTTSTTGNNKKHGSKHSLRHQHQHVRRAGRYDQHHHIHDPNSRQRHAVVQSLRNSHPTIGDEDADPAEGKKVLPAPPDAPTAGRDVEAGKEEHGGGGGDLVEPESPAAESHGQINEHYYPELQADSGYFCVDILRLIAVVGMVWKNVVGRFTLASNPVARALGGDWVSPLFVMAAGMRLAAEQRHLQEQIRLQRTKSLELETHAFFKQFTRSAMIFLIAAVFVVIVFGPKRLCVWDILIAIAISWLALYPVHRAPLWVPLVSAFIFFWISPVIFWLLDASKYYTKGYYNTLWGDGTAFGSLVFFGPTPLFPMIGFMFLGDFLTRSLLTAPFLTESRRAAVALFGVVVLCIGVECVAGGNAGMVQVSRRAAVALFGVVVLCIGVECVAGGNAGMVQVVTEGREVPDIALLLFGYSVTPFTAAWSMTLAGAYITVTAGLASIFDPITSKDMEDTSGVTESALKWHFMNLSRRTSKFTMSLYIYHVALIVIPIRIAGCIIAGNQDEYMVGVGKPIWSGNQYFGALFLVPAGVVYFVLLYAFCILWEEKGKSGLLSTEWISAKATNSNVVKILAMRFSGFLQAISIKYFT
ncbi:hypothetical protein Pelo_9789 [Pelomyxa schiedti]|nr:hypothetical protein Pelo_9789 [Pelomyxa schiedti]